MKLGLRNMASISAFVLVSSATMSFAEDIQLAHDKNQFLDAMQLMGVESEAATGNKIAANYYSTPEGYKAFINSSAMASDLPAMFTWWTGGIYEEIISTGLVANLDDVWDEMVASGNYSSGVRDLFSVDGTAYAVPLNVSFWVGHYNKSHFADAGISVPATWDDLISGAEKLKAAGHTPFHATLEGGWRGFIWFEEIMIRTNPQAYLGLHDGSVSYNGPEVRKAFEIWSDWYAKGWFSDPRALESDADFVRGKGSIYLVGDWAVGGIASAGFAPGEDFDSFIFPNMNPSDPPAAIIEGGPILVSAKAYENQDVKDAVRFWVSPKGAQTWAGATGNTTGNAMAPPENPVAETISGLIAQDGFVTYPRWWEAVPAELQSEIVAEFNRFMLSPTMETAEEVMQTIDTLASEYFADN